MDERIAKEEVLEANRLMRRYGITERTLVEKSNLTRPEIRECLRGKVPFPPSRNFRILQKIIAEEVKTAKRKA